jgi:photosynthetic reaction center cytochrome c subunit
MFRLNSVFSLALIGVFLASIISVLTLERPPVDVISTGGPGIGMQTLYNPASVNRALGINRAPTMLPAIDAGPAAGTVYKNVQVLQNVSTGAFGRLMVSMTQWVAPQQGCGYCHVSGNFASDAKYTKVVARRMLQMTIAVHTTYTDHVGDVGVTCYTCHRGNNNPSNIWFTGVTPGSGPAMAESRMGKNLPAANVNGSSLPSDPYTPFLLNDDNIRVSGSTALPSGNRSSIKNTEWTYALMMTYAQGLGVSCEYCHNSRAFNSWDQSTPQRVTAFYAEAMLRDLNNNYMVPLTPLFPAALKGPSGDVAKINCATCHQGVYKPLFGAKMAVHFPPLEGVGTTSASAKAASGAMPAGMTTQATTPSTAASPSMPANASALGTSKP